QLGCCRCARGRPTGHHRAPGFRDDRARPHATLSIALKANASTFGADRRTSASEYFYVLTGNCMSEIQYDPIADLFPLMQGDEFDKFCAAVKSDGRLLEEIVLLDSQILDGRNRERACEATGVVPRYRQFRPEEEGDPLAFVIGKNLHRR